MVDLFCSTDRCLNFLFKAKGEVDGFKGPELNYTLHSIVCMYLNLMIASSWETKYLGGIYF